MVCAFVPPFQRFMHGGHFGLVVLPGSGMRMDLCGISRLDGSVDLRFNLHGGVGCIGSGQTADHGRIAVQPSPAGCHGRSHDRRRLENGCAACEPW